MRIRVIFAMGLPLFCGSCSYSIDIVAGVLNGRLAFSSLDADFDCIANIDVTTESAEKAAPVAGDDIGLVSNGGAYWWTNSAANECSTKFPVVYGRFVGVERRSVAPKQLRIGVVYDVNTQGSGAYGRGRFIIRDNRKVENLAFAQETSVDAARRLALIRRKFS